MGSIAELLDIIKSTIQGAYWRMIDDNAQYDDGMVMYPGGGKIYVWNAGMWRLCVGGTGRTEVEFNDKETPLVKHHTKCVKLSTVKQSPTQFCLVDDITVDRWLKMSPHHISMEMSVLTGIRNI